MSEINFDEAFERLTGNRPFPWQRDLYENWFSKGKFPDGCTIPTGLGKTSVVAVWLIALANAPDRVPRRLVYVVNRRTVVDQTTTEAEKMRRNAEAAGVPTPAISTLRGQFADNREWSADPSRPAIVVGTVDMVGSRLLFSGYGIGFKTRPLHAGFLGQDVLLVHDEAHLEPAFQNLVVAIQREQREGEQTSELPWPKLRVIELSATSRGGGEIVGLTEEEKRAPDKIPNPPVEPLHHVWRRQRAKKAVQLHENQEEKKLTEEIAELALKHKESGRAVLVFMRTVESVGKVVARLKKEKQTVQQLTGTLRGLERDRLVEDAIFARFLPLAMQKGRQVTEGTVYLVCTSAGEVGVNISADHLVCDLTTFDSMVQRFGRVNRFGDREDTQIDVVHPKPIDFEGTEYDTRRCRALEALWWLLGDGSPAAIDALPAEARIAAFAPPPTILASSDILFDNWALTTIRGKLPGRPMVEPYLHGISDWEPQETYVGWREEVGGITESLRGEYKPQDLLEDYPLKPHELLREPSRRVVKHLKKLAERRSEDPVWVIEADDEVKVFSLAELTDKEGEDRIAGKTVLLSPRTGGLEAGMLNGDSEFADDVADKWFEDARNQVPRRRRIWSEDPKPTPVPGMRLIREIDTRSEIEAEEDVEVPEADEVGRNKTREGRYWRWYVRPRAADDDLSKTAQEPVNWDDHTRQVTEKATRIAAALGLPDDLQVAIQLAAKLHDLGKRREVWQRSIGNPRPREWYAKSGKDPQTGKLWRPIEVTDYRHEFGSLVDVLDEKQRYWAELRKLSPDMQDVVLHLIAVHHGYGRPHFPAERVFDPEAKTQNVDDIAAAVTQRFGRLQRRYGRWGLAYLESLLRAADYAASSNLSQEEGS